jgi:DNA-binding beta-propeller fold protein YncE
MTNDNTSGRRRPAALAIFAVMLLLAGIGTGAVALLGQAGTVRQVGAEKGGAVLLPTDDMAVPVGVVRRLEGARPKDVAPSPDGMTAAVLTVNSVAFFRTADGEPTGKVALDATGPLGIVWSPDGRAIYASLSKGRVARLTVGDTAKGWTKESEFTLDTVGPEGAPDVAAGTAGRGRQQNDPQVTGLAVSPDGKTLYAGLGIRNAVAVVSLPEGKVTRSIPVGVAPYHLTLSPDGRTLAVANRGGRAATEKDPSAPSAGTLVRVDPKTDAAASGSITLLDTATGTGTEIPAGRQPGGMAFSPDSKTLYATSSDDDTIQVLDVAARRVRTSFSLRPSRDAAYGQIPTSVSLSADGATLYVACGGANEVAVLDARNGKITRRVPTAWFPIAVTAPRTGGSLVVASTKGFGSRVKRTAKGATGATATAYYVHGTVGTVQFIADNAASRAAPAAPVANTRARRGVPPLPVPERSGEPSVFKHVVYIIKENHTYDSMMGDMAEGNGDPSLCLFGENITPNHHALAREFVLLDNTYTSGTNSADGHQWTMSGVANAYMEQNYAAHVRSYPYDGDDPLAYSPRGFLWNAAVAAGRSVRVYGEFVNKPSIVDRQTGKRGGSWSALWQDYKNGMKRFEITSGTDNAALRPYLHPHYIGFPNTVPDQWRADQFLADVDVWEKPDGKMPDLSILLLPNDHTMGTSPSTPTPRASVADNDLALGRIVERLSKSRFWPETLILVMEDDSQLGLDHVDGHRTVAFCISPYTRRGAVVSELYNHTSMLNTIERILNLKPMTRFDAAARPLTACFTTSPDLRPYQARPNRVPLDEMNPPAQALRGEARRLAEASARQDWSDVDRADAAVVARAVWHAQKPGRPFPVRHFTAVTDEDD